MGKVYLVGAGPGDLGLITVKGLELVKKADVIIYDHLANNGLLDSAGDTADLIYVGKQGADHAMDQDDINRLIADKALTANIVVRLKGGDPFIFGRGGEEAEVLAARGIDFEIVPGVTSGISVPAYAGIPLTHRDFASSVAFITGHEDEHKNASTIRWHNLAAGPDTLVFLMGIGNLLNITDRLIACGKDPSTPAAVIQWGTLPRQRIAVGTLANIAEQAKKEGIRPPGIIVIGQVVTLRSRLQWFEKKPLFTRKIAITRSRSQSLKLGELLTDSGAEVLYLPTIEIVPITPNEPLAAAIECIHTFDCIVFTSVNSVALFFDQLRKSRKDSRALAGIRIIAIGPATDALLNSHGITSDIVPERYTSEGIVDALKGIDLKNHRFLLPRAEEAREIISDYVKEQGGFCTVVALYETSYPAKISITPGSFDLVTFTSSSTVKHFVHMYGTDILDGKIIASIGPVTSDTLKLLIRSPDIEASQSDIPHLVDAIHHFFSSS